MSKNEKQQLALVVAVVGGALLHNLAAKEAKALGIPMVVVGLAGMVLQSVL